LSSSTVLWRIFDLGRNGRKTFQDFTLIKIDLPGHGLSKIYSDVHSMELNAEEVKKVTDKLKLGKFHLLGHSMGGYTSLAFAEKFPDDLKSLTLFFSTYFADDEEKKNNAEKVSELLKKHSELM
jgi:pimeloyl-ACP methyl ester carboxylesterase